MRALRDKIAKQSCGGSGEAIRSFASGNMRMASRGQPAARCADRMARNDGQVFVKITKAA
jgi:hypothetical protein